MGKEMTKNEVVKALDEIKNNWTPKDIDDSIKMLIRVGMNHAFVFAVKEIAKDAEYLKAALELIDEWDHQFDID